MTRFALTNLRQDCNSGGVYVHGPLKIVMRVPIADDGGFRFSWSGRPGRVDPQRATFSGTFGGRFTSATTAAGTIRGSVEYDRQGALLKCTSGRRPWTASPRR